MVAVAFHPGKAVGKVTITVIVPVVRPEVEVTVRPDNVAKSEPEIIEYDALESDEKSWFDPSTKVMEHDSVLLNTRGVISNSVPLLSGFFFSTIESQKMS